MLELEGRLEILVEGEEAILEMQGWNLTLEVPHPLALWRKLGTRRPRRLLSGLSAVLAQNGLRLRFTRNGRALFGIGRRDRD